MTVETYVYPLDADMMCIYIIFLVCNDPSMSNLIESLLFGVVFWGFFFGGGPLSEESQPQQTPERKRQVKFYNGWCINK